MKNHKSKQVSAQPLQRFLKNAVCLRCAQFLKLGNAEAACFAMRPDA